MTLTQKLNNIQVELKAPKGQYNSFGNYKYRSCEDILEALKPLMQKYKTVLLLKDEIVQIGDRYYVKAIATLCDTEEHATIEVSALARESLDKKGMDDSQITGATSSYARKYALNGLFLIDDTKDADTMDNTNKKVEQQVKKAQTKKAEQNFECHDCAEVIPEVVNSYSQKMYKKSLCRKCQKDNQIIH